MSEELTALVVDDELPAVQRLGRMLDELEGVRMIGSEMRPERVVDRCRELAPELVFLDVEMPGLNGVSLAGRLRELDPPPLVVFVTAHEHYAVEAFDLAAADYLLKPVRPERLARAVERARRSRATRREALSARLGGRMVSIPVERIRVLLAEDKYTTVYSTDGEALVDDSLVSLEQRFGKRFVRVHRNALVSRFHIRALYRDGGGCERLELEGVSIRPEVSRRNRARVRKLLKGET